MNRRTLSICFFGLLVVGAMLYRVGYLNDITRFSEPRIRLPGASDLGEQEYGATVVAKFDISNVGGKPLALDQFRASCSCTAIEQLLDGKPVPVESIQLSPGEHATILARISVLTTKLDTPLRVVVNFRTNDPVMPEGSLVAEISRITGGLQCDPKLVQFGEVKAGVTSERLIVIRDSSISPRSVESVESDRPELVSVQLLEPLAAGLASSGNTSGNVIARCRVKLCAMTPQDVEASIRVRVSGENRPPDAIPVYAHVTGPVSLAPRQLLLPIHSNSGSLYRGTIMCRSVDGSTLALAVEDASAHLTATVRAGSDGIQYIDVSWDRERDDRTTAALHKIIRIRATVGEDVAQLEIPVVCRRE